jgi:hypothetical protein
MGLAIYMFALGPPTFPKLTPPGVTGRLAVRPT